jgi:thiamine-phosphate pyrophosphorylase
MDEHSTFSEGARRVLAAAQAFADASGTGVVETCHLMHALWQDESRAAEILARAGLADSRLQSLFPLPRDVTGSSSHAASPSGQTRFATELSGLSRRARRLATDADRQAEVGTEHLLAALIELDAQCARLLGEFGIEAESVATESAEPLKHSDVEPSANAVRPTTADVGTERPATGSGGSPGPETLRILDAASNRCREGLRVVEDYVRFALNDGALTAELKTFRHALVGVVSRLGGADFHRLRDTIGDVGTEVRTGVEPVRGVPLDVVRSNCKRVEESLRTLEEFGKLIDPDAAAALEKLRYGFYTLERTVLTVAGSRERLERCQLYLLVTEGLCRHGLAETLRGALPGSVDCVQLREKGISDRLLIATARQVREWTREAGALFIVNDRPDIAVLVGADGVHVGQDDLPVGEARRIAGADRLIGVSTHSIEQARQAVLEGADYLGVGPVFPSGTKDFAHLAGLEFVRQAAVEVGLPWFAIGGITAENVGAVVAAGARRVAVSGAVCGAENPAGAARQLRAAIDL